MLALKLKAAAILITLFSVTFLVSPGEVYAADITQTVTLNTTDDGFSIDNWGNNQDSSYLRVGSNRFDAGFRFSLPVPPGAVIKSAMLVLPLEFSGSPTVTNIKAEKTTNSTALTSYNPFIPNRTYLAPKVAWTITGWGKVITSPDITSLIQQLVDQAGWQHGGNILLSLERSGSSYAQFKSLERKSQISQLRLSFAAAPVLTPTAVPTPTSSPSPTPTPTLIPTFTPTPAGNLIQNPGFESGITPWGGWEGSVVVSNIVRSGSGAAKVAYTGTGGMYTIGTPSNGVINVPGAGYSYKVTAWVKGSGSSLNKETRLVIREKSSAGSTEVTGPWVRLSSNWQQVSASHSTAKSGSNMDIYIVQKSAVAGDFFMIDDIWMGATGVFPTPSVNPTSIPTPVLSQFRPFHPSSIWNKPIGLNPTILYQYGGAVSELARVGRAILGIEWGGVANIYKSTTSSPLRVVERMAKGTETIRVPEPVYADPPDQGNDRKLIIDDLSLNKSYGLFRWTKLSDGTYSADSGGWTDISPFGDGIKSWWNGQEAFGGRAANLPYRGGFITLVEMKEALAGPGYLNHALEINLPVWLIQGNAVAGKECDPAFFVWPARCTDGRSSNSQHFLMGQKLQLDPGVNVDALPLSPGAKVIAKTLQIYGGWVGDSASEDFQIQVQEFLKCDIDRSCIDPTPWAGVLKTNDLSGLPLEKMRVIQVRRGDFYEQGVLGITIQDFSESIKTTFGQVVDTITSFFR